MGTRSGCRFVIPLAMVWFLVGGGLSASAIELVFTLDTDATSFGGPATLQFLEDYGILPVLADEQAPGSTIGTLSGTFTVDVDSERDPTSIQFLGGAMTPVDNGDWLPGIGGGDEFSLGDPAPGFMGWYKDLSLIGFEFYGTLRDMPVTLSTPTPTPVTGGAFSQADQFWEVDGGTYEFNLFGFFEYGTQNITEDIPNEETAPGTYSVSGNTATITLPVRLRAGYWNWNADQMIWLEEPEDIWMDLTGAIVATAAVPSLFEADFDGDGDVDGDDFLRWQSGFGTPSGATKMDGDFDNDGDVDGDDFLGWQTEFPSPGSGAASGAVPEPASHFLAFAALSGAAALVRRRCGHQAIQQLAQRPGRSERAGGSRL